MMPGRRTAWFAIALAVAGGIAVTACSGRNSGNDIDAEAREYVELGLDYAAFEPGAFDFYFGPQDLAPAAGEAAGDREAIRADLEELRNRLTAGPHTDRRDRLLAKVASMLAMIDAPGSDGAMSFAQQAERLYGIEAIVPDEARLQGAREELEALLPGNGSRAERVDAYAAQFVIPEDRRRAVFLRALDECRGRTRDHWALPPDETLDVEWTDTVDAAWHRYQGDEHSVLQVNPAAVADIGSALDVACHEAYPGHHAQFLVQGEHEGLALEDTLVFTRSPDQLLREGAAQYGIDLTFPLEDRIAFLRDDLFPLAGFDPDEAPRFAKVHAARQALGTATAPIIGDYLDGRLTAFDAGYALKNEALVSSSDALLGFARQQGAYVLGYSLAREAVESCVIARAGRGGEDEEARWEALYLIVAASDLAALKGADCPA